MQNDALPLAELVTRIQSTPRVGRRRLVGVAGAPASGKSTLAEKLAAALTQTGTPAQVVPMDGFHLDNTVLEPLGLLPRKGAPQTFDAAGFVHLVRRLQSEDAVAFAQFDRARDIAVAGSGCVTADCETVIVEGNYLLFDMRPWHELAKLWDLSIRINPPLDVLRDRLVARWVAHGLPPHEALARAETNDLENARSVAAAALAADITISGWQ